MKRAPLAILFITLFIDLLGFGLILPLLPIYITHYGGSSWIGGLLFATFSLMQFIFAPIWGRLSDRYGRRPLILLSLSGSAVSYYFFGAAPNLAALFIARVASGILTAASLPTSQAYIADVTPPEKRAGGMAMVGAAFGLGFAFGPWIGSALSKYSVFGHPPLATPAYFAAALAFLNFILALFLLPETHHNREKTLEKEGPFDAFVAVGRALHNPAISAALIVFVFSTFAFTAVESSFSWLVILRFDAALRNLAAQAWQAHNATAFAALAPAMQKQLTEKAATAVTGGIFGIVGVTILMVQGAVMGGLARRIGEIRLVVFGALLLTATLLGTALAPNLNAVRILSALIALGSGVMNPSLSALITQYAGPSERGTISGAQHGLSSLARIVAPPINNYLVGVDTAIPFVGSAVLMGIAFLLSLRLRPAPPTSSDPEQYPIPPAEPKTAGE